MSVADAAAGARLGSRVRRHSAREVVRLRREQQVPGALHRRESARAAGILGEQRRHLGAEYGRGVVLEGDHRVVGVGLVGLLDEGEERVRLRGAVDGDLAAEEPVAAVLRV